MTLRSHAALSLLLVALASPVARAEPAPPPLTVTFDHLNEDAPDFKLSVLNGPMRHLKDGKPSAMLLHFWATWCAPCKAELPQLIALGSGLASRGIRLLIVSVDEGEERSKVAPFFRTFAAPPEALIADASDPALKCYLTWGLPVTYAITAAGKVVGRALGSRPWSTAKDAAGDVAKLLATPP